MLSIVVQGFLGLTYMFLPAYKAALRIVDARAVVNAPSSRPKKAAIAGCLLTASCGTRNMLSAVR